MGTKTYAEMSSLVTAHNKSSDFSNEPIIAIAWKESSFNETAENADPSSSATGLMQLTKAAVADVNANTPNGVHFEHSEMKDGEKNIECGTYYLQILFDRLGSQKSALNHFGTGDGYCDNLLICETCLKTTPADWDACLGEIHQKSLLAGWARRRLVENGDGYLDRVAKYIPAEIVSAYLALGAAVPQTFDWLIGAFILCWGFVPLYVWKLSQGTRPKPWKLHALLSSIAFPIWAYAIGGPLFPKDPTHPTTLPSVLPVVFALFAGLLGPPPDRGRP